MATLEGILSKIRENVVDVPSDTESRLVGWVNEAQLVVEAAMEWTGLNSELVVDTVAGVRQLSLVPSDWLVAVGDPYYLTGTGSHVKMEWIASRLDAAKDYSEDTATSARSAPKGLLELGETVSSPLNRLLVYPFPDASNTLGIKSSAGEYEVHVPYRARAATLVTGGVETNFFTTDKDLQLHIEDFASGKAMLFNRDFQNGEVSLVQAKGHLTRAKRIEKRRKGQFLKLTPRRDVHASRRQRRAV